MNVRRIGVLLHKELTHGSRNFIFIFAVVMPVVLTLVVSLLFGSLFSDNPRVGVFDSQESALTADLLDSAFLDTRTYDDADALRNAVETGAVDVGIAVPDGFDALVASGDPVTLTYLVWGESLANQRAIVTAAVTDALTDDTAAPVTINAVSLGDEDTLPLADRMLSLLVLMAVVIGGSMIPATSLVEEKQKRTLRAVVTTPTTLAEVFISKGALGALVSVFVGVAILALNNAFGTQPFLLLILLALGGLLSAEFGVLLGAFVKDINTLFATIKAIGLLLYAPAFIALFPDIPQWIAQVFPTYYIVNPIVAVTQQGADLNAILPDVLVLLALILAGFAGLSLVTRRMAHTTGV